MRTTNSMDCEAAISFLSRHRHKTSSATIYNTISHPEIVPSLYIGDIFEGDTKSKKAKKPFDLVTVLWGVHDGSKNF